MEAVTICQVCDVELGNNPNLKYMKELLPPGFQHCVCAVTPIGASGVCGSFRVDCRTVEDTQHWIASFHEHSKMTFRVDRTRPSSGCRVLYNCVFRCMHNTRPRSTTADLKMSSKNTNCPARMTVRLLRSEFKHKGLKSHLGNYKRKSQSKDSHLPNYPLCITVDMNHNHAVHDGDVLHYRDVGPEARRKIECLLRNNHSPSSALKVLKYELQVEHPEDYFIYAADRHHCPDLQWCYRLYYEIFRKQHDHASESLPLDDVEHHHSDEDNQSAADETMHETLHETIIDNELLNRFAKVTSKISDMYKYDPVKLGPSLEAFCRLLENIPTASAMRSALNCFGKYVRVGKRLSSVKKIGVQPTAIARRKAALGQKRTLVESNSLVGHDL